ncbi:MAG: hypothetical protein LBG22_01290 [Treponema sp.]|jgi:hypothetical protein|nr:hypothetical protein [Treponema sp.]
MKKHKVFLLVMLAILLTCVLVLAGCDNGTTSNDNNSGNSGNNNNGNNDNNNGNNGDSSGNPFVGTWVGTYEGSEATAVISSGNTWKLNVPDANFKDEGTYSTSGSTATLTSTLYGGIVTGTATVNADGTITIVLNENSVAPGTYTLRKQ